MGITRQGAGVAREIHEALLERDAMLRGDPPDVDRRGRFARERRRGDRRVELGGMAAVPGLDRRRGERRAGADRRDVSAPVRLPVLV
jgi:hypothetical protein